MLILPSPSTHTQTLANPFSFFSAHLWKCCTHGEDDRWTNDGFKHLNLKIVSPRPHHANFPLIHLAVTAPDYNRTNAVYSSWPCLPCASQRDIRWLSLTELIIQLSSHLTWLWIPHMNQLHIYNVPLCGQRENFIWHFQPINIQVLETNHTYCYRDYWSTSILNRSALQHFTEKKGTLILYITLFISLYLVQDNTRREESYFFILNLYTILMFLPYFC